MRFALALSLLAAPLSAQSLDGLYYWSGSDPVQGCQGLGMSDTTIEIGEGAVWFLETRCDLTNPVALRDMPEGMLYDGICSGEGETWTERMLVYKTFDGVAVLSRGAARTYTACP